MSQRQSLKDAVARLRAAGVETPVLDARLLVQHALGADWNQLYIGPDRDLTDDERSELGRLIDRRAAREPVSRILGNREFWSLNLLVGPDTLDPRPDTETIIDSALKLVPDRDLHVRVLDLGTGTGAILLALLTELPNATGLGIDRAPGAVATATENAQRLGLDGRTRFRNGDWGKGIDERFDLIVSNPPYIRRGDIAGLSPEVRDFDPVLALDGGPDGLDAYRELAPDLQRLLDPGGCAVLEVGQGQAPAVMRILEEVGLRSAGSARDLGGIERCVIAQRQ
ncbi:peptide chain release factor N(5)-glutamine methyltransferase [Roseiterribacter gracilis]|uniref:Release factor glutamine methyltransferase n=1 Tax=Roseiterribacter gracilis TaxID=2812848 RepID=A0A8S8XGS7_9PROT|nr:release factor glutamine methyltransferase [Rhodospirillales bacterium TMPK1]